MMALKSCVLAGLVALAAPLSADGGEVVSPEAASRLGMIESWQRPLRLIGGADSVVDIQIHVEGKRTRQLVEVVQQVDGQSKTWVRIPVDLLDHQGQPIGLDEAQRRAAMEVRRLARRGITATVSEKSVPEIRLYTLGRDGTVEARDAETGRLLWANRHGDPRLPYMPMGINDDFVTFLNGSTLIQLSSEDGRMEGMTRTQATPAFGASIVGQFAVVPTLRGGIEGYPLEEIDVFPFIQTVAGRALAKPIAARGSTRAAWPTDHQFVYVMETLDAPSVLFRLNTDGEVTAPLVAVGAEDGEQFFFASNNGQVYGLQATRMGKVLWRQSLGQPVYSSLFLADQRVLVPTLYGNVFSLNLADGSHAWNNPARQIDQVLCLAGNKIFVRTTALRLAALNPETGAQVQGMREVVVQHYLVNSHTDRLYLLTAGGTMQCLRPVDAELPTLRVQPVAVPTVPATEAAPVEQPSEPEPADPFDGGASPFGVPGEAADPAVDPFATPPGAVDPFGGESPFGN